VSKKEKSKELKWTISYLDERRLVDVRWTMNRLLDEIERNESK